MFSFPVPRFVLSAMFFLIAASVYAGAQVKLSPEEAEKLAIEKLAPRYPKIAESTKLQGTVKLSVSVSRTGVVVSVKSLSGHPFLIGAATEAVRKRRYKPYELNGQPTGFVTEVEIKFSAGIPDDEYELELENSRQYFQEQEKCVSLLRKQEYVEAETTCKAAVSIADRLPAHRGLEISGAYSNVGQVMMGLRRFQDALTYFTRSYEIGKTVLTENDAETAYAYINLGLANHLLGKFDIAVKYYDKAEAILRQAYKKIDMEDARRSYVRAIKAALSYRLDIAQRLGDPKEIAEIKKRMNKVP